MIVRSSMREKIAIEIHNGWMEWMEAQGYSYGPRRDVHKKEHPHFIPWDKMEEEDKVSTYASALYVVRLLQREDVYI